MTANRADAVLGLVLDILDDCDGAFTALDITRAARPLIDPPPTTEEVSAVFDVLTHPLVDGIAAGDHGAYVRIPRDDLATRTWNLLAELDDEGVDADERTRQLEDDRY
ncbi:hypothetical protein [Nocardia sp. CC227C]|uniref:hypothetical protein n=1 Tax=Nocardia sp. CC227C TaxID=3044562 RepID=UPI00278BD311|nr:hypothetical protein [Nocardia sp. CC227C]